MESLSMLSPFGKIKGKYVIIEILINIEYNNALRFLWEVNKHGRTFVLKQLNHIENAFANNGLFIHTLTINKDKLFNPYC